MRIEQLRDEDNRIWSRKGLQKHQWTRFVASGANRHIGFFTALDPDCAVLGTTDIRITKQPKHGAVNFAPGTGFTNYGTDNIRHKCNQRKVKRAQVTYKSAEKYIGKDAIELLVLFPDGFAFEVQYDVSVR